MSSDGANTESLLSGVSTVSEETEEMAPTLPINASLTYVRTCPISKVRFGQVISQMPDNCILHRYLLEDHKFQILYIKQDQVFLVRYHTASGAELLCASIS